MFKTDIIVAVIQQFFHLKFNFNLDFLLINRTLFEKYNFDTICFVFIMI